MACDAQLEHTDPRPLLLVPSTGAAETQAHRSVVEPLAPERYKIQVTVSGKTVDRLRRVQDLMRHTVPDGDPAAIIDRALMLLLEHLERTKLALTDRPRAGRSSRRRSRHIPAAVRRAVWRRDGGQCTFVGPQGRCTERGFLEFHHVDPHALGREARMENIRLRCRAHNLHEDEQKFCLRPATDPRHRSLYVREDRLAFGSVSANSVRTEFSGNAQGYARSDEALH